LTKIFGAMNLELPATHEQFRALVESAKAAGDDALFASLIQLAPAFNSLQVAMEDLGESAEQTAKDLERIAQERISIEEKIMSALGDTAGLRQRELDSIDASNRGLMQSLYAIKDARNAVSEAQNSAAIAMESLQRSVDAERSAALARLADEQNTLMQSLTGQQEAARIASNLARESASSLQSLFDYIGSQIEQINNDVDASRTAAMGMQFISQAVVTAQRTGYLPSQDELASAITSARSGLGAENFATSFEMRLANMKVAAQLGVLGEFVGEQLTTAEKQLATSEQLIERLDLQMEATQAQYEAEVERTNTYYDKIIEDAQAQLDALNGVDKSVLSVADAVKNVETAIGSLAAAMQAQAAAEAAARSAAASGGGGGMVTNQSGYRLVGNTLYFPGGGTHTVSGANGAATLAQTYGLVQGAGGLIRTRANGGFTPSGMTLVGERGPELINFDRPGMVYNNDQLRNAMSGGDTASELKALREENRAQSRALVSLQARMTRILEQWNGDGLPTERYEGETA